MIYLVVEFLIRMAKPIKWPFYSSRHQGIKNVKSSTKSLKENCLATPVDTSQLQDAGTWRIKQNVRIDVSKAQIDIPPAIFLFQKTFWGFSQRKMF